MKGPQVLSCGLLLNLLFQLSDSTSRRDPHLRLSRPRIFQSPLLQSRITILFSSLVIALNSTFSQAPRSHVSMSLENNGAQERIIIIGAGIIGPSTAYSLALDLKVAAHSSTRHSCRCVPKITVVESSHYLCPAASSQATGGLGDPGFGNNRTADKAGVGSLSYKMHVDMAAKYIGKQAYCFGLQVFRSAVVCDALHSNVSSLYTVLHQKI